MQWRYPLKKQARQKCPKITDYTWMTTQKVPTSNHIPELLHLSWIGGLRVCLRALHSLNLQVHSSTLEGRSDCVSANAILAPQPFRPKFCLALDIRSI